jgi:hypothetical protein
MGIIILSHPEYKFDVPATAVFFASRVFRGFFPRNPQSRSKSTFLPVHQDMFIGLKQKSVMSDYSLFNVAVNKIRFFPMIGFCRLFS